MPQSHAGTLLHAVTAALLAAPLAAQSVPAGESELPEDVRTVLATTQDFAFNFDQPGFYAVLEQVDRGRSPGWREPARVVKDWRDLLERPSDFRGHPITIEGRVGRNKDPYTLASRPELGPVSQLELERDGEPLSVTAILTEPAGDIPVGATVTITGYFVMIRQYRGPSGRDQPAALLVAPGPLLVTGPGRVATASRAEWGWVLVAAIGGLLLVWFVVRRAARAHPPGSLHARQPAPINLADALADWAGAPDPGDEDRPPAAKDPSDRSC